MLRGANQGRKCQPALTVIFAKIKRDPGLLDISDNLPVDVKGSVVLPVKIENEILPVDVKRVAVKKVISLNEEIK